MKTLAELQAIKEKAKQEVQLRKENSGYKIVVGMATCGIAAGARPVMTAIIEEVEKRNLKNVVVAQTGCVGLCQYEPIVDVYDPDGNKTTYIRMTPEKAVKVVLEHLVNGKPIAEFTIGRI
ncbi:MAG: (2Fe-2S) ferredoxin domain-containing protein [Lachnospiraceae bacterium]|nr:(2Fe-2S) ferredoxin domain-containing protein [Lachnospiraceae bacterium]